MREKLRRIHHHTCNAHIWVVCAWALFLAFAVIFGGGSVYGAQEGDVYDDAALLTDAEIDALNEKISTLQEESGWKIYAVTTSDAGGKTATEYADDFFDTHATPSSDGVPSDSVPSADGVALLIDMDNREITISTCGIAIRYLTDDRIDAILDDAYTDVSNGSYGACMDTMLDGVERYYQKGIPEGQYNYDTETGEVSVYRTLTPVEILIAAVIAVVCGAAVYLTVLGKYRLKFGTYQYEFRENGRVALRVKEDRFVNQMVTHRRIPKQTESSGSHSSGRSSTHTGSSGSSHGGGSRKF